MTKGKAGFELRRLGRVIDVVRVVVACQFDMWWVQVSLLERSSGVEKLVHSTVADPAGVIQAAVDFEVDVVDPPVE